MIDPALDLDGAFDVLIADGRIESIARTGQLKPERGLPTIDARGLWITPGFVDPHVHLRDPGFPQKETIATGLRAAAAGGFTAVAAMANTSPVNDHPEITGYMLEQALAANSSRLVPVSAVSKRLEGREFVDYARMAEAGARLFSDDGIPVDDQDFLVEALRRVGELGFAISLHEEDRHLSAENTMNSGAVATHLGLVGIPAAAESLRVRRDLALAETCRCALHLAHVSTAESVEIIKAARHRGVNVTCEVAPHHFALDENAVAEFGPMAKMNPPLRSKEDVYAIQEAISDGTVDMIATDHAPHDPDSKVLDVLAPCFGRGRNGSPLDTNCAEAFKQAANGVVGLETAVGLAMELVDRKVITPRRMVELMALNPAKLLRLDAGDLRRGRVADITIIDPARKWTVDPTRFQSRSHNSPFVGKTLSGKVMLTIVGGAIVFDGGSSEA